MAKSSELRDMSEEQIRLTWKEAAENLFRLRIQAQTERLDVPTELKKAAAIDRPLPDHFERAGSQSWAQKKRAKKRLLLEERNPWLPPGAI